MIVEVSSAWGRCMPSASEYESEAPESTEQIPQEKRKGPGREECRVQERRGQDPGTM